jgi:hypothetical protein
VGFVVTGLRVGVLVTGARLVGDTVGTLVGALVLTVGEAEGVAVIGLLVGVLVMGEREVGLRLGALQGNTQLLFYNTTTVLLQHHDRCSITPCPFLFRNSAHF